MTGDKRQPPAAPGRASTRPGSDIPFDASIVPAAHAAPAQAKPVESQVKKWVVSWMKSAAATLGAMYIVGWVMLTFGVAVMNSMSFMAPRFNNTARRMVVSDAARPYGLAPDQSITPERAGRAYLALVTPSKFPSAMFPQNGIADRPVVPWRGRSLDAALFKGMRSPSYPGPSNLAIAEAVKRGFSPAEKAVLKEYATAPVWREFDAFARAPAADMIGARFALPFRTTAVSAEMPLVRFAETKEMGYASVARAAWHLSEGRRDSAEFALRSTISFGRAMSDNATVVIEQLIGAVITNIGRDALIQLYTATGDPRGVAFAAATAAAENVSLPPAVAALGGTDVRANRAALLEVARSPATTRGLRYEALQMLTYSSCSSVRELLTGPNASVREAFAQAKRDLARYPSEIAYLDLISESLERIGRRIEPTGELTGSGVLALAGRIYFNPRLGACAMATPLGGAYWNMLR